MDNRAMSLQERDFLNYLDHRSVLSSGGYSAFNKKPVIFARPSKLLVNASIVAFVGAVFFIVGFTSPYWLQSYTYSNTFVNMGLWEICFDGYRHFDFQYDKLYNGCNHLFSYEYQQIREWILPGWLMTVQAFVSLAFVSLLSCLVTLCLLLTRLPLKFIMRQEWKLVGFSFICEAVFVGSMFLAVLIFGTMCWTRSWLLYPNFNYLSFSYIFCVISGGFEIAAGLMLWVEMYEARERKRENSNLLQMQPQGGKFDRQSVSDAQGYI